MRATVLCIDDLSNYRQIPDLDLWDAKRNTYNCLFPAGRVIAHPPCAQWSKLKALAKPNEEEKNLAWYCLEMVRKFGGVLEHPEGSAFFKEAGISPTITVDQSWWGFPARKRTHLYFVNCSPSPALVRFGPAKCGVEDLHSSVRSRMTLSFCAWLVASVTLDEGTYLRQNEP